MSDLPQQPSSRGVLPIPIQKPALSADYYYSTTEKFLVTEPSKDFSASALRGLLLKALSLPLRLPDANGWISCWSTTRGLIGERLRLETEKVKVFSLGRLVEKAQEAGARLGGEGALPLSRKDDTLMK